MLRNQVQASGSNAVLSLLEFLHLLKCDAKHLAHFFLRVTKPYSVNSDISSDNFINSTFRFRCHSAHATKFACGSLAALAIRIGSNDCSEQFHPHVIPTHKEPAPLAVSQVLSKLRCITKSLLRKEPTSHRVAIPAGRSEALLLEETGSDRTIRRVGSVELNMLANVSLVPVPPAMIKPIEEYFLKCSRRPSHFDAGIAALGHGNFDLFVRGHLYPARRTYENRTEYERAWDEFRLALKPLDLILIADRSLLSRFIAGATHGPWSHIAVYMGHDELSEILTSGARRAPIEVYNDRRYRLAAYRIVRVASDKVATAINQIESQEQRTTGYSYREAIRFGWRTFLGDHAHNRVPNSIMYSGRCMLVAVI